jgi:hypothetical protein
MARIFSTLLDYMESEHWKYDIIEGETILRFHFKTNTGRLLCFGDVDEEKQFLVFHSWLPIQSPPEKIPDVAEYLSRANRGLSIGNFEFDYDTGDICCKTSIDIEGGELTFKMIDNLLRANLTTCERYFRGLMEVLFGDREPRDAIQAIERPNQAKSENAAEDDGENPDFLEERDEGDDFRRN